MSKVIKVYKVKDTISGLYRTAGGGWSATGKTWNNLGHLKSSIGAEGYYRKPYRASGIDDPWEVDLPPPELQIIEIEVVETEGNTKPMCQLIEEQRRLMNLKAQHGQSLADLVDRIEKDDQAEFWQWVLVVRHDPKQFPKDQEDQEELKRFIKANRLKRGVDFRMANAYNGGMAIAFKDRGMAALARLGIKGQVTSLDIKNFIEADLDNADDSSV